MGISMNNMITTSFFLSLLADLIEIFKTLKNSIKNSTTKTTMNQKMKNLL